jgi:hypothetical protein
MACPDIDAVGATLVVARDPAILTAHCVGRQQGDHKGHPYNVTRSR